MTRLAYFGDKEKSLKAIASPLNILIVTFSAIFLVSCISNPSPIVTNKPIDPNTVTFQSSATYIFGTPLNLKGKLMKPEGNGLFPAVVLLHGCGGISLQRDNRWMERLLKLGYVTLQVDSFGPRHISSVCTYSRNEALDILDKRVNDAYDAKKYLAELPFVDRSRIAVMGWSHGGLTTLEVLYKGNEEPFRAAIAFYPSCRRNLANINAPLLILIGDADDWTPASRCVSMMPQKKTLPEVILKLYPGAYHGFDLLGANRNVQGSNGMHHLEYQQEAETDSISLVKGFFEKHVR